FASCGHTRRVGQHKIALVRQLLGCCDCNFPGTPLLVVLECGFTKILFHDDPFTSKMNETKGMIHTSLMKKLQSLARVGENTTGIELTLDVKIDILRRIHYCF